MSIDWITVAAQIANFLVLVWLLKRFLYRPILDGIDAREAEILARMQEAGAAKAAAAEAEADYQGKVHALNAEQAEMAETIRKSAEAQRDTLLAEAQQRMEREHADWQAHLGQEAQRFRAKMQRVGAGALLSLTGKALTDLSDETLEARIAHHLVARLDVLSADMRRAAGHATEALVTSHQPLSAQAKATLTDELQSTFPKLNIRFETDDDQSPGIVLAMGGAQVAWTIEAYVDGLDALINERLGAQAAQTAQDAQNALAAQDVQGAKSAESVQGAQAAQGTPGAGASEQGPSHDQ